MLPAPVRGYRYPERFFTNDHPWYVRWGIGYPTCCCCGAALTRRCIEDSDGQIWGVDCLNSALGRSMAKMIPARHAGPTLSTISRSGVRFLIDGGVLVLPVGTEAPDGLIEALAPGDRKRWERYASRQVRR